MTAESLTLIEPTECLREDFLAFRSEFLSIGETHIHGIGGMKSDDFDTGLRTCRDQARGANLPEGWAPASTLWLVRNATRIIGTIHLRHWLPPSLEHSHGHVGYGVRPSERRKGYATRMLGMTLDVARRLGLTRLLVTCDRDNIASVGVILKNGGVFDGEVISRNSGRLVCRYWINLSH